MSARTQDEIVARVRAVADRDLFGFRTEVLIMALDYRHVREFVADDPADDGWGAADAETVEREAREYYAFALGKIEGHRGISARRSVEKLTEFAWLLGRDDIVSAMEAADYEQYGAPKVKEFGVGLGLEWPSTEAMTRMAAGEPCRPDCDEGCER
ncbi:hypothetical protein ACFQ08_11895 [Streptosporangium algeriense]|uniref:Uncharacterized protein n=1 Tax=Streptosporangium algeriense TaxID=1682748 RepID=A0ABW3DRD0_9ACTN